MQYACMHSSRPNTRLAASAQQQAESGGGPTVLSHNLQWPCHVWRGDGCKLDAEGAAVPDCEGDGEEGLQDVFKAKSSDIQKWATVKLHPNFNTAFAEAGMPFDFSAAVLRGESLTDSELKTYCTFALQALGMVECFLQNCPSYRGACHDDERYAGDDASVQAAIKACYHKKLQRIIEGLLGTQFGEEQINQTSHELSAAGFWAGGALPDSRRRAEGNFVHQLTTDFYGNYTLQDLIGATKRMRCAVHSLVETSQMAEADANVALGRVTGRDYLGGGRSPAAVVWSCQR